MSKIHLITYAEGFSQENRDFKQSQEYIVNTIESKTNKKVIFHSYDLKSIKQKPWFKYIKDFPSIPLSKENKWWNRGGYWCTWKAFLCQEVLRDMEGNDLIYYIDSSRHYRNGITENIDAVLDFVLKNESIFGASGNDCPHMYKKCLDNTEVWSKVWPESLRLMPRLLYQEHILSSWMILKKDTKTINIIDKWVYLIKYYTINNRPVFSFHHTGEQGILNILIYQYNLSVFFINQSHSNSKDPNLIHQCFNKLNISSNPPIFKVNDINIP
jgi:hypothetical protein